jgi:hypothetical protein
LCRARAKARQRERARALLGAPGRPEERPGFSQGVLGLWRRKADRITVPGAALEVPVTCAAGPLHSTVFPGQLFLLLWLPGCPTLLQPTDPSIPSPLGQSHPGQESR